MVAEHVERLIAELRPKCPAIVESPWLEAAVRAVPRHLFIERYAAAFNANDPWGPAEWVAVDRLTPSPEALEAIYSDRGLMMKPPPEHSAASQPALVLMMLHELGLEPGMKVLEIGTGSGWNAALIARGVGSDGLVHSVDIQRDLVERARAHLTDAGHPGVRLHAGDGAAGLPQAAPFDRIIATVGCPDIPPAWLEQLTEGGVLLVPLLLCGFGAPLLHLRKTGAACTGGFRGPSGFMTLQGAHHTDTHDQIIIDDLPKALPVTSSSLPESINAGFLWFLCATSDAFRYAVRRGEEIPYILHHVDTASWITFMPDDPSVRIVGESRAFDDLRAAQEEWMEYGRPSLTSFDVDVVSADEAPAGGWLDARRSLTLRYRLQTSSQG